MKKIKILVAALAISALLAVALVPAAFADNADYSGTGTLHAQGTGIAQIKGKGEVWGTGKGGLLAITDNGGGARIEVSGEGRKVQVGNTVIYYGFDGRFFVAGRDIVVRLEGARVDLTAVGTGTAFLKGHGKVWINGRLIGLWSVNGGSFNYGP